MVLMEMMVTVEFLVKMGNVYFKQKEKIEIPLMIKKINLNFI